MKCKFCKRNEATSYFMQRAFCQECFRKLKKFTKDPTANSKSKGKNK